MKLEPATARKEVPLWHRTRAVRTDTSVFTSERLAQADTSSPSVRSIRFYRLVDTKSPPGICATVAFVLVFLLPLWLHVLATLHEETLHIGMKLKKH